MDLEAKYKFLLFSTCAVAPFSVAGSSLTLITIARTWHHHHRYHVVRGGGANGSTRTTTISGRLTTYHRLIVGTSLLDFMSSIALSFGPLPMPAELGFWGMKGTLTTCSVQAFFVLCGMGSFLYNCFLMWYYVLVIRFNLRQEVITRWIEPLMHLMAVGYYLGLAIAGLILQVLNASSTFCLIAAWPLGCDDEPDVQCTRGGEHIRLVGLWLGVVPFMLWNVLILIALVILAATVFGRHLSRRRFEFNPRDITGQQQQQQQQQQQAEARGEQQSAILSTSNHTTNGGGAGGGGATSVAESHHSPQQQPSSPQRLSSTRASTTTTSSSNAAMNQVLTQCLLYAVWFSTVMIFSTIGTILGLAGKSYHLLEGHFWIAALSNTLFPSQGAVLFLIFIRPRYLNARRRNKDLGCLGGFCRAVWDPPISFPSAAANRHHHHGASQPQVAAQNEAAAAASRPSVTVSGDTCLEESHPDSTTMGCAVGRVCVECPNNDARILRSSEVSELTVRPESEDQQGNVVLPKDGEEQQRKSTNEFTSSPQSSPAEREESACLAVGDQASKLDGDYGQDVSTKTDDSLELKGLPQEAIACRTSTPSRTRENLGKTSGCLDGDCRDDDANLQSVSIAGRAYQEGTTAFGEAS